MAEKIPDITSSRTIPQPPFKSSDFLIGYGFSMSKIRKRINERMINFQLKGNKMPAQRYPAISSMTTHPGSLELYIFFAESEIKMEKAEKTMIKAIEKVRGIFLRM